MLSVGERIDVWVVEEALGVGGMASVYRCHNAQADRIVGAVKVLDELALHRPDAQARFIREAEVLFGLDHPGVVKIRDVRADHDPPYLVMEYVEGQPLSKIFKAGALPVARCVDLLEQLAEAVAYLHVRGVRHRDLKPANILIRRDGSACIVDFGLVLEAGRTRLTADGIRMGTVAYVPPEWATPSRIDPVAWDVYALGTVIWEMLTGERAFSSSLPANDGPAALQIIAAKQDHAPLDPGPEFWQPLRDLIGRMTHPDPGRRPLAAEIAAIARTLERSHNLDPQSTRAAMQTFDSFADEEYVDATTADQRVLPTLGLEQIDSVQPAEPKARGVASLGMAAALSFGLTSFLVAVAAIVWVMWPAAPVTDRPVVLIVVGLPGGTPFDAEISGLPPARIDQWTLHFDGVAVGAHEVVWAAGEGCSAVACGGPCACGVQSVDVSAGEGPWTTTLAVRAPIVEEVPQAEPTPPGPAEPRPAVVQPAAGPAPSSGVVSRAQFSGWLKRHPEWLVEAATGRGKAGPGYLTGWTGGEPPSSGPMTHASWYAAMAYCEGRGGLAGMDDPPLRWEGGPFMEWRQVGGKVAWRSGDSRASPQGSPLQASASMGLRCRN